MLNQGLRVFPFKCFCATACPISDETLQFRNISFFIIQFSVCTISTVASRVWQEQSNSVSANLLSNSVTPSDRATRRFSGGPELENISRRISRKQGFLATLHETFSNFDPPLNEGSVADQNCLNRIACFLEILLEIFCSGCSSDLNHRELQSLKVGLQNSHRNCHLGQFLTIFGHTQITHTRKLRL